MSLEKLFIQPLPKDKIPKEKFKHKIIKALFNPNSYTISKSVNWKATGSKPEKGKQTQRKVNAPTLEFGGGESRTLSLDLFFDVTEAVDGYYMEDVREATDKIVALTRIWRELKRPPICELNWGNKVTADFPFHGVLKQLTQKFTFFDSDGIPLRATMQAVFLESLNAKMDQQQTDPELTTRIIKQGDTLQSIAAEAYGDPAHWRMIAEANDLDDPLQLPIAHRLTIPQRN